MQYHPFVSGNKEKLLGLFKLYADCWNNLYFRVVRKNLNPLGHDGNIENFIKSGLPEALSASLYRRFCRMYMDWRRYIDIGMEYKGFTYRDADEIPLAPKGLLKKHPTEDSMGLSFSDAKFECGDQLINEDTIFLNAWLREKNGEVFIEILNYVTPDTAE
jgi:hypothetical protein